jgi:3-isopropylmalate/(R)-2-methylmalate dehydratase large subunit
MKNIASKALENTKTLLDRIWEEHVIVSNPQAEELLWVDLNLVHEGGTFMAFDQMRLEKRRVRKPLQTLAVTDHYLPSLHRSAGVEAIANPEIRNVVQWLAQNTQEFGIEHIGPDDPRQGITHVIAPELGLSLPGLLITCCDSHTATQGAMGCLAMPIGQSNQLRHVLATQTIWQKKPRQMRITLEGTPGAYVSAKDIVLYIISKLGIGGAVGHAIEYAGPLVRALSIEARLTLCNMSIEAGARMGIIAPDDTTFEYLAGRAYAPKAALWEEAVGYWRSLHTGEEAVFDKEFRFNVSGLAPMVSWGTSPEDCSPVSECVPDPSTVSDPEKRARLDRALHYMQLEPGRQLSSIPIDRVFIGSCTNARIEDLRVAAQVVAHKSVVIPSIVVPGSTAVKKQAEAEGLDQIFLKAGFEWRDSSCSMCGGSNGDIVPPGMRSASTTNRNFEGRQGIGALTHIMSPAMAAAAAIAGCLTDVRQWGAH